MKRVFKTYSFVIALTMAALMTGSQALGQNLEPVAGLGATYYPNIMYESDTVRLNWLGPLNVTEPSQYFRIYRTDADTNEPYTEANTALIADSVVGQEYLVSNFGQLSKGKYKYGVSAVYDVGYVPPAPGVLISENFENGIPSNWTLVDADNDGDNWFAGDPVAYGIGQAHSGSKVVTSWSWNNMTLNPDHYMIIPLQGVATQMRFFAATNVAYPDHYGVFVSSTTMDLDSFRLVFEESWSSLAPARERETSAGQRGSAAGAPSAIRAMSAWKEVTVDLPSDARYVAFRHYNSYDNNYLFIDDITVYGEISNFWKPGQADIYWSLPIERGTAPERLRVSESGLAEWLEGAGTENPYTPTLLLLQDTLGNIVFRDTTYNNYLQLPFDQLTDSAYYDCLIAYIHSFGMSDTIQTRWLKVPTGQFTITVNDVTYRIETDGTATVVRHVDGQNATGTLTLVDTVEYGGTRYPVKAIGTEAFQFCSQLTGNLVIPNTVTTIGGSAFFSCSGFNGTLSLPTSLTTVGLRAFYDCSGLTGNLVIPNTVTSLGNFAFQGCSGLNGSLTLSNNLTSIGTGIFMECNGLSGVLTIPEGVTSITERAFYGCSSFTQLVLPNSLNTIGKEAFVDCTGLTGLALPYNLLSVGEAAFKNCSGLSGDLVFSNRTTTIGVDAFRGCTGLNGELVLGRAMTSIGKDAFYGPTFSSVTCLSLNPPQSESTVPVFSPFPPVVYIPCGSAYNTQIWAGLNRVQMCYLTASPDPLAMGDCPAGAWKRPFRFTLTNSSSSALQIVGFALEGSTWNLVDVDLGSYTLPISVGAGDSVTLGLSRANDYGIVSGKVRVQYTMGRDTLDNYIPLTARFFTPIDGDVWELARPINTYPYNEQINGSSLHNTYFLPCSNIPDGKNMVYKLVLTRDKLLDASVTGENGKVAVYAADFGGLGGPDVSNCLNSVRTDGTIVGHWLRPGTYYLVASSTASSFSLSVNTSALPCPAAPTIVSPANLATNVSLDTKTLRWSFGNYTTQYRLEFGADASNLQTLVDWTDSLRTEYTLTDSLDYSTCYTWKVSTRNVDCQDSTYAYGRFYTPILAPNELNSLEAGKLISGETLHLTWNAPSAYRNETPSLYNVYVRTSSFDSFTLIGNAAETEYERTGIDFSGTGDYNQYEYAVTAVYDLAGGEMVESPLSATHVVQVYNAATATGHVYKLGTTMGIAGATLTFTQGARNYVFTTDVNGAWSGSLPVNTFPTGKVTVSAPGYRGTTNSAPVPIVAGITNVLDCELEEIILGPYNVTVTAKPLAGGAVFGAGTYDHGDTCTLSVSSYRGYYLSYWTVNDSTVSNDSVYSFVVTEDANCVAHFDRFPYSITAKAEPADYGTVEGAGTYKHFDAATLLAKPNKGYQFVRWTLNGEEVSTTAMYSFLVTGPAEYVAQFDILNAMENISGEAGTQKLLRNGILYILRSGILYDSLGRKITN